MTQDDSMDVSRASEERVPTQGPEMPLQRSAAHSSSTPQDSTRVYADKRTSKHSTVSPNLMWTVIGAVLGLLMPLGWHQIEKWYDRPRLEIHIATSLFMGYSREERGGSRDYAVLYDMQFRCPVFGYRMINDRANAEPWHGRTEAYWKLILHNPGHSTLSNLNFSVDSTSAQEVTVETSPNLIVDHSEDDTEGFRRIATVREMPPGTWGVLTVRAFGGNGTLSVQEHMRNGKNDYGIAISNLEPPGELRFESSSQLKPGDANIRAISTLDSLNKESAIENISYLQIPLIRSARFSGIVDAPVKLNFDKMTFPADETCPTAAANRTDFSLILPINIGKRRALHP